MSSIAAVAAEAYTALEKASGVQSGLDVAVTLIGEVHGHVRGAFEGGNDPEKAELIDRLKEGRRDTESLVGIVRAADALVRPWIANEVGGAPAAVPGAADAGLPGSWRERDAVGHAHDAGRALGRAPGGSKKHPVREVRSTSRTRRTTGGCTHFRTAAQSGTGPGLRRPWGRPWRSRPPTIGS